MKYLIKHKWTILLLLSVSLIASCLTAAVSDLYYANTQFQVLGRVCGKIVRRYPDQEQGIMEILKSQNFHRALQEKKNVLSVYGYGPFDFFGTDKRIFLGIGLCFLTGGILFVLACLFRNRQTVTRIRQLTNSLEKINTGGQGLLADTREDEFSQLRDEIYKTMTSLYQTREAAVKAKEDFADNLSNIAHQLKTPITAISLLAQMITGSPFDTYAVQIKRQLHRLTYLEEALLLLSRIDAGTLTLKPAVTDVFTLLTLSFDNLRELLEQAGVSVSIPEQKEIHICADPDWTMEALLNLMKNCMEHSRRGGGVHCSYEKNPLYVQIRIWDEGQGFEEQDLPHIFERFYRGRHATNNGIGIGLPLAKALIEMQNGVIRAFNLATGGACFEVRFYSH